MGKPKSKHRYFVLLGAHVSLLLCGGSYRSYGVLLVEWKRYFNASSAEVSSILSVMSVFLLLSGGAAGPLCNRYGCHKVTLLGACISIAGMISSVFAVSPLMLCFTIGVMAGTGLGLVYNASTVIVAHYFKKGYTRANGVASAGVALGIMILPPFFQFLINIYGWRGTILIFGGIQGHVIVSALLFWPRGTQRRRSSETKSLHSCDGEDQDSRGYELVLHNADQSKQCAKGNAQPAEPGEKDSTKDCSENCEASSAINLNYKSTHNPFEHKLVDTPCHQSANDLSKCDSENTSSVPYKSESVPDHLHVIPTTNDNPSAIDANQVKKDSNHRTMDDMVEPPSEELHKSDSLPSVKGSDGQQSWFHKFLRASGIMLFKESLGFVLVTISQITIGVCYTVIMTHFVASVVYKGVEEQSAAFLVSVLGIASLVARLGNGWFIDHKLISPVHLYILAMMVCGGSTILSRAQNSYGWYVFIAILFGLSSGLFKCLLAVVLRRYVGVPNLAPALGVNMIFLGIGDLMGPIFAGALYDATDSYNVPFFVAGSILLVSASLFFLEPLAAHCKARQGNLCKDAEQGAVTPSSPESHQLMNSDVVKSCDSTQQQGEDAKSDL